MSVQTRHVASLHTQAGGDAAVAVLDNSDRLFLELAVQAYTTTNRTSVAKLAKEIGVGRTYFYNLIKGNSIELSRLEQVQKVLDINILEDSQIDQYVKLEKSRLSSRPLSFNWTTKCPFVTVNGYYFVRFLLPAIKSQTAFWGNLYSTATQRRNEKGKYEVNPFEEDAYRFQLLIDYAEQQILGADPEDIDDKLETAFYEGEKHPVTFRLPVTTTNGLWADIEEVINDRMYDYCWSSSMGDYFEELGDPTQEEIEELYAQKLEQSSELHSKGVSNEDLDREIEYLSSREDYERMRAYHKQFNKELDEAIGDIVDWVDEINEYCKKKARQARRKNYFPLELRDLVNDLKAGTFQLPIVAGSPEASPPHKVRVM
jgi:hypothetical protein